MHRFGFLLLFVLTLVSSFAAESAGLSGTWRLELDRSDVGIAQQWFARDLGGAIELPGSVQKAGLGDLITLQTPWTGGIIDRSYFTEPEYAPYREEGRIKVPFWLQPDTHYVGPAWYQRRIELPEDWREKRITLVLERAHWVTSAWVDGRSLGSNDANSVAHVYELPADLAPGAHVLTLRVDNRLNPDLGINSHSVSDHTQGNWNGIEGRIELRATQPVWIEALAVDSRVADRVAVVRGRLASRPGLTFPKLVVLEGLTASRPKVQAPVAADGSFSGELAFGPSAGTWDEFSPVLHTVKATLENGEALETSFGFRQITARGRQLFINGRRLFLRGTLDCAAFPKTGNPPTDPASWSRIFGVIKAYGLNHVRFHSWCPPEAAFVAADAAGLYLQIEAASWPNQSTRLGEGLPVDAWLEAESSRIVAAYGNHPSFVLFCAGNEPGGAQHPAWLGRWVLRHKAADPQRLYTAGAGWPEVPESDYHVRSEPRIQSWGEGLGSRINARAPETRTDYSDFIRQRRVPVVSHEIGQWCVYPNFDEMPKYTGYLKPRNFEIFRDSLQAHGMLDQAADFVAASGKLQTLCYKEDIEAALRTGEMGGFQLLGLQDFPGQGTALVGVVDPFWEEKGYVSAAQFRRFCNSTVPLARLDKRVFTTDEHLVADVELAHFGAGALHGQSVVWSLLDDAGATVARGDLGVHDIPVGAGCRVGRVDLPLSGVREAAHYRLMVALPGTAFANDWDLWVYPAAQDVVDVAPEGVLITTKLDAKALACLEEGKAVWLMAGKAQVRPDAKRGPIALGFSSIFWNTAWTQGQPPHTLGLLCDPRHPALRGFPTESHSNWQWWYPLHSAAPMILDGLPQGLRPIVQVIDDWVTNRKLALVFEARVGRGRLLVSSIDLSDATLDPVRRQLRASLLEYVQGDAFNPAVSLSAEALKPILSERPLK
jgi:hypothetical protein